MALFQFNGYDLNNYFKLIKVEHEIGNERSISTDSAPSIGVNVQQVNIGAKKIKVTVSLATRDLADMTFIDPNQPAPTDNGAVLPSLGKKLPECYIPKRRLSSIYQRSLTAII